MKIRIFDFATSGQREASRIDILKPVLSVVHVNLNSTLALEAASKLMHGESYSKGIAEARCRGRSGGTGIFRFAGMWRGFGYFFTESNSFRLLQVDGHRTCGDSDSGKSVIRSLFWKLPRGSWDFPIRAWHSSNPIRQIQPFRRWACCCHSILTPPRQTQRARTISTTTGCRSIRAGTMAR